MSRKMLVRLFFVGASCGVLWGQGTSGTVTGRVMDSSGGVLPRASVLIQNIDTGIGRTVVADERGYYTAPNLSLGKYEITAGMSGFQTEVRRGITLNVGQNAVIDFTLQVGAVTERVEVTADAPLVETTNGNVGALITEQQLEHLPLNARNLIDLAAMAPGVSFSTTGGREGSKGFGTKLTISGTRYNASLFQLDGVSINDSANTAGSATGILMGMETVREFNVVTGGYSAEYGNHTGGIFNAVTKSGTNAVHGSVFEFLRNDKLDAARWEDNALNKGLKAPFKRNQFGASVGGPLLRDRSFFFGSYEGLRQRLGNTQTFFVPGAGIRQGQVPNLSTGQIASVQIASAVRPFLESYPLPNGQAFRDGTAEYINALSLPTNENFFTVRADHKLSDQDSLFGRYTRDAASDTPTYNLNTFTRNETRAHYAALGETRIFSPRVINQFLAGFTRTSNAQRNTVIPGITLPAENFTGRKDGSFGGITVPTFSALGGGSTLPRNYLSNMFQFKDDVFYTRGAHALKFGFNAQRYQFNHFETFNGGGNWAFNSVADFLQGIVNSYDALTAASDPIDYVRQTIYGFYAQDDYRVSAKLTLNLGLRYEFTTTPVDKYGRLANLKDFYKPNQTTSDMILGNPWFLNPSLKNFAPRLGLAWDPTGSGKTSIRAGAGIFHEQINAGPFLFGMLSSPPFYVVGTIRQAGLAHFPDAFFTQQPLLAGNGNIEGFQYEANQPAVYKYSLDIQREVMPNTSVDIGFSGTRGVHLLRVLSMNPRVAQLRDGRLFVPCPIPIVGNPCVPADFLSPKIGRIRPRFTDVTSSYYALRLSVTRRFSRGLQVGGAFTWSKTIDDGTNFTGTSDFSNSPGSARYLALKERGLAAFDLRRSLSTNFSYDLPGGKLTGIAGKMLGGWQVNGIVSLQDGPPDNVSTGVQPSFIRSGFIGDYPDLVGTVKYAPRNPDKYFEASAFALPPGYLSGTGPGSTTALGGAFIGNTGRSSIIAPGTAKFDLVFVKTTALSEKAQLQFRSEFFNLFNRANFNAPNGRIFASATADAGGKVPIFAQQGRITGTGPSRQVQFGLRLAF